MDPFTQLKGLLDPTHDTSLTVSFDEVSASKGPHILSLYPNMPTTSNEVNLLFGLLKETNRTSQGGSTSLPSKQIK